MTTGLEFDFEVDEGKIRQGINKILKMVKKDFESKSMKVLRDEINRAFQESQNEVPVDTGTLKRSGFVEVNKNSVSIGYATPEYDTYNNKSDAMASDYFWRVHEDLFTSHQNGKAKFLEDPVERAKARINGQIKTIIRRYE